MKGKILIFGGTTEGRILARLFSENEIPHRISVATQYGARIEYGDNEEEVLIGKKDGQEIAALLKSGDYTAVVDATHPFAVRAHEEIRKACESSGILCLRLKRPAVDPVGEAVYVDTTEEAAATLNTIEGKLFLLTGAKELDRLLALIEDKSRVYVRVLPEENSIRKCREAGLLGKQIIAMQGPISEEMNAALFQELGISAILTKESGETGGFEEKLLAASKCKIRAVVLKNPEKQEPETGVDLKTLLQRLEDLLGFKLRNPQKRIVLAGIGPGDERFLTGECREALNQADVLFGAESVVKRVPGNKKRVFLYEGEGIHAYLEEHPAFQSPAAVFSGDISLCSGAKKAEAFFLDRGYEVRKLSGISSVTLFAGRLSVPLEETVIVSAHGKDSNVCGHAGRNEHLIVLSSGAEQAKDLCRQLFESVSELSSRGRIVAGAELGTEKESVYEVKKETGIREKEGRLLLYIHNPGAADRALIPALPDTAFLRGAVPMTKEEVRGLSLRKLALKEGSVLYDIGAGTGSVSAEAAMLHPELSVYSVEKKAEALELLRKNKERLGLSNMRIIEGEAPKALQGLARPTHAFIGGSGGRLFDILRSLGEANENIRIVLNVITPETLAEVFKSAKKLDLDTKDISAVQVTRFEKTGAYQLPKALNPVYIIVLERRGNQ